MANLLNSYVTFVRSFWPSRRKKGWLLWGSSSATNLCEKAVLDNQVMVYKTTSRFQIFFFEKRLHDCYTCLKMSFVFSCFSNKDRSGPSSFFLSRFQVSVQVHQAMTVAVWHQHYFFSREFRHQHWGHFHGTAAASASITGSRWPLARVSSSSPALLARRRPRGSSQNATPVLQDLQQQLWQQRFLL